MPVHMRGDTGSADIRPNIEPLFDWKRGGSRGGLNGSDHGGEEVTIQRCLIENRGDVSFRDDYDVKFGNGPRVVERKDPIVLVDAADLEFP